MDNKVMYNLSYGLFILTARQDGKDNGCIVNTVTQVTTDPNRITVTVNKANLTHDMIMETGYFNVSILTEKSKFDTYKHWGFQSGRDADKLEAIEFKRSPDGISYITSETNAYISAKVIASMDLGTHSMFIADVIGGEILQSLQNVIYKYCILRHFISSCRFCYRRLYSFIPVF